MKKLLTAVSLCAMTVAGAATAATCGNDAGGFNQWKQQFASEAAAKGVGQRGLQALAGTSYATRTISADRNQKSFKYQLLLTNLGSTLVMSHVSTDQNAVRRN